jgi:hypothetical protein
MTTPPHCTTWAWPNWRPACAPQGLCRRSRAAFPGPRQGAPEPGRLRGHDEDATLAQARAADARLAAGTAGALEGVPLAHKDIFVTRDFPSTAGSKMLAGYRSPLDATVVRQAGRSRRVTLGKLNCDEFAMGSANENSAFAPAGAPVQPLGHRAHARRLVGRQRRGRGRAPGAGRHRHRHRRLDPPAGRFAASPASSPPMAALALRHDRLCLQPGPGRPDGAQRRGLRPAAVGHVRPTRTATPPALDVPPKTSARSLGATASMACASACPGVLRRRPGGRRARRRRGAWPNTKSSAPRWCRSACRAPSCRSRCTTSLRRPRPARPT